MLHKASKGTRALRPKCKQVNSVGAEGGQQTLGATAAQKRGNKRVKGAKDA